jgi:hypothetical protein
VRDRPTGIVSRGLFDFWPYCPITKVILRKAIGVLFPYTNVPKSFTDFCLILHIIMQFKYRLYSIFVYFILCFFSEILFKKFTVSALW